MFTVTINGKEYNSATDKKLLSFLRDDLRLTGAKNGCSEGVCGTCTVLVDGKKQKACVVNISKLQGKKVLTVEGIDPKEMAVYRHAFAQAGAVQCGFCTPGMIIAAKSLLDQNLNPSLEDVKKAINGNLCRCTGYKKIEQAILDAALIFREGQSIPQDPLGLGMNQRAKRIDASEKVDGTGVYTDDIALEGMIYAHPVFSKYPRARVEKIDISKALAHPDCITVLTKKDVPCNRIGHIKLDVDLMMGVGDITRYVGDVIALVASKTSEKLQEICALVDVEYTELEPVTNPFDALRGDAPLIHEDGNIMSRTGLVCGNADEAIAKSKYSVTRKYKASWQDHGFLEPECCVAVPEGQDGILIYTACQSVYDTQRECAMMLNIPLEKVHCRAPLIGGAFGGKEDMTVQPHAALMAWVTKKPVKVKFTRQESLDYHVKRHPMELEFTTACDENGILTGMKGLIIADTGAYASMGGPVLARACTHASGPYNYHNVDVWGISVYTNNMVAGAFRGFGVPKSCFATEMNINLLAEMVGLDPWEFRRRNVIKPGDRLPNGQTAGPNTNMAACLDAIKDIYYSSPYAGIACGFKNSGLGLGKKDVGRVLLSVEKGKIHIRTSAACMGQGIGQMTLTEICHVTGLNPHLFLFENADTVRTPDSGTSAASRQTVVTGEAARLAAEKLKNALDKLKIAHTISGEDLITLEGREFLGEFSAITQEPSLAIDNPTIHIAYSYGAQVVILDEKGKVVKAVSAFDVGTPVNLQSVEGQLEGGMVMGLGYALSEKIESVGGYPHNKFGTVGFMRAVDAPELEVILCQPKKEDLLPYSLGAKGCGELCMIPTAPACAMAYYRLDGQFRSEIPLKDTPYSRKGKTSS